MKVLIIGAGRMGIRHAIGVIKSHEISELAICDISSEALNSAKSELSNNAGYYKCSFYFLHEVDKLSGFDIGILATTASERIGLCNKLISTGCSNILVEKPLGQSKHEVNELQQYFEVNNSVKAFANLNMRADPNYINLKNDLLSWPQFNGPLSITLNTGAVGIGANGIHLLDFLYFITEATDAKIIAAHIDDNLIPSARGECFKDFGGWCIAEFYNGLQKVARAYLSISSESSSYGGLDIVGPHGRILFNEANSQRIDFIRRNDSFLPAYRYNAEYLPPSQYSLSQISLSEITHQWVSGVISGKQILPTIKECIPAHELMFEWLHQYRLKGEKFPIT